MKKNYILDTNVLLHDPDSLLKFEDNTVLLPIEVMPFVILLEERKKLGLIHSDLWKQIQELDNRLKRLELPTDGKDGQP